MDLSGHFANILLKMPTRASFAAAIVKLPTSLTFFKRFFGYPVDHERRTKCISRVRVLVNARLSVSAFLIKFFVSSSRSENRYCFFYSCLPFNFSGMPILIRDYLAPSARIRFLLIFPSCSHFLSIYPLTSYTRHNCKHFDNSVTNDFSEN